MTRRVVIIGAGMGGLTAAIRLARRGFSVRVIEARTESGGLASRFETQGFVFDAGRYILLDRLGLEWAFRSVGIELSERLALRRIEEVYEVQIGGEDTRVRFFADLQRTAAEMERNWVGSGSAMKTL
jgi:phytoene dehydrogenase-like protein